MPRAHLDPIVCVDDARAVFALQMSDPVVDETLVMLLDDQLCGSTLLTISGTHSVEQLLQAAEAVAMIANSTPEMGSVVIASVRREGATSDLLVPGLWSTLDEIVEASGVVLLDWLVTGPWGLLLPRALCAAPSRWPADG